MFLHLLVAYINVTIMTVPEPCPEMVSRLDWGARQPKDPQPMLNPVPYVIIHHTYQPGFCGTTAQCSEAMRGMQTFHQQTRGWSDIGYSFAIGGDGKVYEGRGWSAVGAHAPRYNSRSIGIVFIGDYRTTLPTPVMLLAARRLIQCGIQRGAVSAQYKLLGHRQVRSTECPGQALFDLIKRWPHFDPIVDIPVPQPPPQPSE